jgi:hypothetical protein
VLGSALVEALGDPLGNKRGTVLGESLGPLLGDELGTPVGKEVGPHRCLTSRASEKCPHLRKEGRIRCRIWESLFRSWYEQETSRLSTKAGRGNNSSGHVTLH